MKNAKITICLMAAVLVMAAGQGFGIEFNDGGTYNINYSAGNVYVDNRAPGMNTTVNLLNGGYIHKFFAYQDSRINVSGGSVNLSLVAYDRTQVVMSGGQIWYLDAYDSSQVTMSGGTATGDLVARGSSQVTMSGISVMGYLDVGDSSQVTMSSGSVRGLSAMVSSQVTISGGTIGSDGFLELVAGGNGKLIINGSNFSIDGIPVGFGETTSILGGDFSSEPFRRLTGTLANGDIINNQFQIGNSASITLVPEPTTLLLLGVGVVMLRRKC